MNIKPSLCLPKPESSFTFISQFNLSHLRLIIKIKIKFQLYLYTYTILNNQFPKPKSHFKLNLKIIIKIDNIF